jgi:hypothetical protein
VSEMQERLLGYTPAKEIGRPTRGMIPHGREFADGGDFLLSTHGTIQHFRARCQAVLGKRDDQAATALITRVVSSPDLRARNSSRTCVRYRLAV